MISSPGPALRIGAEHRASASLALPDAPAAAPAFAAALPVAAAEAGSVENKTLVDLEREHILATLERTYWRLNGAAGAAALLGMNPSTLRSRMRELGIERPR